MEKIVWKEHGFWWVRNEMEDDAYGPFDTVEEAHEVYEEMYS